LVYDSALLSRARYGNAVLKNLAGAGCVQAGQYVYQGRFAAFGRTEENDKFIFIYRKTYVPDYFQAAGFTAESFGYIAAPENFLFAGGFFR